MNQVDKFLEDIDKRETITFDGIAERVRIETFLRIFFEWQALNQSLPTETEKSQYISDDDLRQIWNAGRDSIGRDGIEIEYFDEWLKDYRRQNPSSHPSQTEEELAEEIKELEKYTKHKENCNSNCNPQLHSTVCSCGLDDILQALSGIREDEPRTTTQGGQ